ncbi:sister chromatid cohesion protein Dcc1 [Lactarius akahatsu]|uniref:Sister chromatid cohesion protein Dcc1 n=1 Tax=Lactarius akahatsu TaxID=416441 RepID=A0AAD4LJB6_9AGAM|nr:sister chromatid cohesion protein Dcc1 [Lactarius akahatsu]
MPEVEIMFSPERGPLGSFRLMELPPDLCKLIESSTGELKLAIKGGTDDDAVLCTSERTYNIRSVVLSNSILVISPPDADGTGDQVVIQDSLNELLELVPTVPRLHRLNTLLKEHEWEEGHEEEEENFGAAKRKRITVDQARAELQASEQELAQALREKHILILDGRSYLILELLLMHLVSLSQPHDAASVQELSQPLEDEHEVKREVTLQVMRWFGQVDAENVSWNVDVEKLVRQVGLGVLRQHKNDPVPEDEFMAKWNAAVGDTFASSTSLQLLTGNYLCASSPFCSSTMLSYFPCAGLPVDPVARFSDLFLTRPRWKAEDIVPYLSDIAVDSKDLDKLLLRYARALTDKDGLWYTARAR